MMVAIPEEMIIVIVNIRYASPRFIMTRLIGLWSVLAIQLEILSVMGDVA